MAIASFFVYVIPGVAMADTSLSTFVQFTGESQDDSAGSSLSDAGDVNGDGYDDFLIGAPSVNGVGASSGAIYLVYGSSTPLVTASVSTAVKFGGENAGDMAGSAMAPAGDINGDGYDDMLIAATGKDSNRGSVYILYGKAAKYTSASLSDSAFIELTGGSIGDIAGGSVAGAGDVNNDGYDDFMIGAYGNNDAASFAGAVYLLYGKEALFSDMALSASSVVKFTGAAANDSLAYGLSSGDLNGDGYSDVILSSPALDDSTGGFYIIYGQQNSLTSMSVSDSSVVKFTGESVADAAGGSIESGADINGDGYDDILVGAIQNSAGGSVAGAAYIVYGQATALASGSLGDTGIVKFTGEDAGDLAGIDVAMLGDVDNDGYDDFQIGGSMHDLSASNAGAVYLVHGTADALTSIDLSDDSVIKFLGEAASDIAGDVVSRAGDINGDGFDEMLVSAYAHDGDATDEGVTYLGYLYRDADGDGVGGAGGLLTGTDCDDTDATVSADQTYYVDADGDGLGVTTDTVVLCSSVVPDGYAANPNDTNDTIANNGVEIPGDGIDNDEDGDIDEDNTIDENGAHPGYGDFDPDDTTLHDTAITSVTGLSAGQIKVTFADTSVYNYTIFSDDTAVTKSTKVKQYLNTGYYVVLQAQGKTVALVNIYDGTVVNTKTLSKGAYKNNGLKVFKLRKKYWAVVTSVKKNGSVKLSVVRVNLTSGKFGKKATATFTNKKVKVNKTKKKKSIIKIRGKKKVLTKYSFTKKKRLKLLP